MPKSGPRAGRVAQCSFGVALLSLALTSCGHVVTASSGAAGRADKLGTAGRADKLGAAASKPETEAASSVASVSGEVFVVPAADTRFDGEAFFRSLGQPAPGTSIGAYQTVSVISAPSNSVLHLSAYSVQTGQVALTIDPRTGSIVNRFTVDPDQTGTSRVIQSDDIGIWMQTGAALVAADDSGRVIRSYQVPVLDDGAHPFLFNDSPRKGVHPLNAAADATAVVTDSAGTTFLFTSDTNAAAITNLATGQTRQLTGYSALRGGTLGLDGNLYTVAWDFGRSGSHLHLVQLSRGTLAVTADWDIGISPNAGDGTLLENTRLLPWSNGVLLFVSQRLPSGVDQALSWVTGAGALRALSLLPSDIGNEATLGPPGTVYVWGGPGENRVALFDPSTGVVTPDVPALRAPAGAYITGLV